MKGFGVPNPNKMCRAICDEETNMVLQQHQRKSIRIPGYDYTQPGWYFVTICTQNRVNMFGLVENDKMILNKYGRFVESYWLDIPNHFNQVELDEYIVMPNHVHGIVHITVGARPAVPLQLDVPRQTWASMIHEQYGKPVTGSLPTILRSYKSAVTKRINEIDKTPGRKIWQRNYWEPIVRSENDLYRIRQYIQENPALWQDDGYNDKRTQGYGIPNQGKAE